jgi:hypothetical protein
LEGIRRGREMFGVRQDELTEHFDCWIDAIEANLECAIRTLVQAQHGALLAVMRVAFNDQVSS